MNFRHAIVFASSAIVFVSAHAQVNLGSSSATYSQNFDSLTTSATAQAFANNSTLAGWSVFNSALAPMNYSADTGSSNAGAIRSFGAASATDRALGAVASGNAIFGPDAAANGSTAAYIALALNNASGSALDSLKLSYTGEQWRNGGNTTAQSVVLQYGFGSTFSSVAAWNTPGNAYNINSLVNTATASALDGNAAANRTTGLGGTLTGLNWNNGDTLWVRWTYTNYAGNDHGMAIDDLNLSVAAAAPVPEPSQYALLLAGLGAIGLVARRRSQDRG